jgi:multiple antibiotic resistance protein
VDGAAPTEAGRKGGFGMDWTIGIKVTAALFAIMNPMTTLPVFLAMTAGRDPDETRRTLHAMLATVVIGAIVCALAGHFLLIMFGIEVAHFRLAGGLIVLLVALSMLGGEENAAHGGAPAERRAFAEAANIGIYPLGIPITLGPGTMATIIIFAEAAADTRSYLSYGLALAIYLAFFTSVMLAAPVLARWMSPMVLSLSRRLMGLILASIAFEMITSSLGKLFPGLLG